MGSPYKIPVSLFSTSMASEDVEKRIQVMQGHGVVSHGVICRVTGIGVRCFCCLSFEENEAKRKLEIKLYTHQFFLSNVHEKCQ